MASSKGPSFLTFNGKNIIHPLNGMRKRGSFKTLRPILHTPKKTSRWAHFLDFFVGKFVDFMFCWELGVETLSFGCYLLLLKFCILHGWVGNSHDHVVILALGQFWIVELVGIVKFGQCWWFMKFSNVCSLWYCWMSFDLNFVGIDVRKIWCVGLFEQIHFWWMRKFCWNV